MYDYQGRRVEKRVEICTAAPPSETWAIVERTRFAHDGWNVIEQIQVAGNDDIVAVTRRYAWGLDLAGLNGAGAGGFQGMGGTGVSPASFGRTDGRTDFRSVSGLHAAGGVGGLLAVDVDAADPSTSESDGFWYCHDANGNVMELVAGATGYGGATADEWHADRLVGRYEHDPYGNVVNSPSTFALTNPVRFSTKYWDDESGLGYWGERYYDTRLGRWINHDPIGELGGTNLYAYVSQEPVSRYDPSGLMCPQDSRPTSQPQRFKECDPEFCKEECKKPEHNHPFGITLCGGQDGKGPPCSCICPENGCKNKGKRACGLLTECTRKHEEHHQLKECGGDKLPDGECPATIIEAKCLQGALEKCERNCKCLEDLADSIANDIDGDGGCGNKGCSSDSQDECKKKMCAVLKAAAGRARIAGCTSHAEAISIVAGQKGCN